MQVILNIGLDGIPQELDNVYSINRKISAVETALTSVQCLNFKILSNSVVQSDTEQTLVVHATHTGDITVCAAWLAEKLNQDCVAVYVPERNGGLLCGPRAEAWGHFNPEFFFMLDGRRLSETLRAAA